MPCGDVTEILHIALDHEDRVREYTLHKKTCGRAVGLDSLLQEWVQGKTPDVILETDPGALLDTFFRLDATDQFMILKHFRALHSAMAAFTGKVGASHHDECTIDTLYATPEGMEMVAYIHVAMNTTNIPGCSSSCGSGGCGGGGGCGRVDDAKKKAAAKRAQLNAVNVSVE
ncbi:MAG: hypothetical protein WCP97_06490 [bacterium]